MQGAGSDAVLVLGVLPNHCAQPLEVEECVLEFQRIEGPLDQFDSAFEGFLALPQLEPPPDAGIPPGRQHPQHVAVQIRPRSWLDARHGYEERDHLTTVVGAEQLPAYLSVHHERTQRQHLDVVEPPDGLLQAHRLRELLELAQRADLDHRLASCHSASSSWILQSCGFLPRSASLRSM